MMSVYFGNWTSAEDMMRDFNEPMASLEPYKVLAASYGDGDYSGEGIVLLREKATGDLKWVEASHCSCYGLAGGFGVTDTHPDVVRTIVTKRLADPDELDHHDKAFWRRMLDIVGGTP